MHFSISGDILFYDLSLRAGTRYRSSCVQAELALLVMDNEDGKKHFDLSDRKKNKNKKKKKRSKLQEKDDSEKTEAVVWLSFYHQPSYFLLSRFFNFVPEFELFLSDPVL